jgi:hypothetical protein
MDFRRGQPVRVFMGAGWAKGTYIRHNGSAFLVELPNRGTIAVYDPRNIRPG